jgi:hypothetical protein
MDRIRFITHQGKRILLVDLSNCSPEEVAKLSQLGPSYVTSEPRNSVLLLADFSGSQVDREALEVLKKGVVFDRPHVKRSAWVGTEGLPKAFYEVLKAFSQRELPIFRTREEALDYLVTDDQEETQEFASPA